MFSPRHGESRTDVPIRAADRVLESTNHTDFRDIRQSTTNILVGVSLPVGKNRLNLTVRSARLTTAPKDSYMVPSFLPSVVDYTIPIADCNRTFISENGLATAPYH